jgi:hypothetical protein
MFTRPDGVMSTDPVVRATAETMTPDLAALAALDAALAAYGIDVVTVEEVARWPKASIRT